ncbi:hypothetical protein [[Clostridium] innocuum]|nr:hypothetical protein [[Clostridium] innocuum]MCR0644115.1 hypothetical protein [[Clostridium] innocuum]
MEGTNVQLDTIRWHRGVSASLLTGLAESSSVSLRLEKTLSSNADAC